jgi:hypothetical protein
LRIGCVAVGSAARALARSAAIHSTERPLDMGLALAARSVLVSAIVPDQKTKAAAKRK